MQPTPRHGRARYSTADLSLSVPARTHLRSRRPRARRLTNAPRPDSAHDRDAKGRSSHWSRQVFSLTNASPANAAKVLQDRQFYFDSSRFTTNFSARGITSNVTG